jgi:hypothetical protein
MGLPSSLVEGKKHVPDKVSVGRMGAKITEVISVIGHLVPSSEWPSLQSISWCHEQEGKNLLSSPNDSLLPGNEKLEN